MRRIAVVLVVGIAISFLTGCPSSVPKAPPLADVSGTVSLDGKPMPTGEIHFEAVAQPPKIMKIEGGKFSGQAFAAKNTVRIHLYKDGPPASTDPEKKPMKIDVLPAKYHSESKFTEDVPEGGKSDYKFEVTAN